MGNLNFSKTLLVLLLLANVGFLGYNAYLTSKRVFFTDKGEQPLVKAKRGAIEVKRSQFAFQADLEKISRGGIIKIDSANQHFSTLARRLSFNTTEDLFIPMQPKPTKKGDYQEETWKIDFRSKAYGHKMSKIANFANQIESTAPGFQIKEIDFGQRSEGYGNDTWRPRSITVRRLDRVRRN